MRIIFNKIHLFRSFLFKRNRNTLLKMHYFLRNVIGYIRGFLTSLIGKIKYEDIYRPLIIGARTKLLVRPGSSIVLKNAKSTPSNSVVFYNNTVFSTATTIGVRPHYDALDPPVNSVTRVELLDGATLLLDQNTVILPGCYISGSSGAQISIGKNTYISQEVVMNSRDSIQIGKDVLIGYQVMMMDYDAHAISSDDQSSKVKSRKKKAIVIGDHVWIGARVTILKGVKIGAGAVIGAHSCVVSDIPANSLAVGNPARVVKDNIAWER